MNTGSKAIPLKQSSQQAFFTLRSCDTDKARRLFQQIIPAGKAGDSNWLGLAFIIRTFTRARVSASRRQGFQARSVKNLLASAGILSCLLALLLFPAGHAKAGEIWIDIDTGRHILYVMDGEHILREFGNISLGRNGVAASRLLGDQKTPLGEYRVLRINRESRFHLFFGFDYPTMDQATSALRAGNITSEDWQAINQAHQEGREPPADTPLGGYIGIHGVGRGDARIHDNYDWTEGCVAVTNEQVDELAQFIQLGTRVTLR